MATITDSSWPNLLNVARRTDPNGRIADIAEVLDKDLDILDDVPWTEANQATGHLMTERTALPSMSNAWRQFNKGVATGKSDTAQFTEVCGMLEAYAKVDKKLAEINGNVAAFRASEAKPFLEAMNQEFARALFYESAFTNPSKIHGLAARYGGTTGYTASSYVLKPGTNAGSNCRSIWLIDWAPDTIFGIYPKASKAGLSVEDRGQQTQTDANGLSFEALVEHFEWDLGVAVKDYRYACRFQWDIDDTGAGYFGDSDKLMYLTLQDMLSAVKKVRPNARFYMDRVSYRKLLRQLASNDANFLTYIAAGGRQIPSFMGVPMRITDALVAEDAIS